MIGDTMILLICSIIGFSIFMIGMMFTEGIFYRPNTNGDKEFTLTVFKDYIMAPFDVGSKRFNTVWSNYTNLSIIDRMKLLQMNWVAMTALGFLISELVIMFK